ncbi:zinc knuckle CX2CX4HX4C containing protein, partial [Tanacetum coccineum]
TSKDNTGGCVDATVRTDGGGVKGLKSPLTTKDNDHAADGITSVCENAIPAIIVGIENVYENNKNGGLVDIVGADVAIPQAVVDMISARFDNTLYWYFIGKRLAFPVVENYMKHVWAKYGLERVMLHQGFFLFKFSSKDGMDSVMKNGPWRIRLIPILLNVWNAKDQVKKEDIKRIFVWVKLFNVPIVAYSKIGLSLITSKLGRLIMKGKEHLMVSIDIEFEWKLPRCSSCKIFDHVDDDYLKKEKEVILMMNVDEGFVHVKRKEKGENTTQQKANTLPNSKDDVNGACDQQYVSTDVHRDDSSLPNNDNGNPKYFKDDIDLIQLRSNLDKIMEEEKVLDINTDFGMDNVVELKDKTNEVKEATTSKLKSPMLEMEDDSDEDEVYMPDDVNSKYISSTGRGFTMEEDELDFYDGYETHIYDLPEQMQEFYDHYDVRLKSHARK